VLIGEAARQVQKATRLSGGHSRQSRCTSRRPSAHRNRTPRATSSAWIGRARHLYLAHRDSKWIRWQGISAHIGSQITSLETVSPRGRSACGYVNELRRAGIELRYLDVGGGLGVQYTDQKAPRRATYARLVAQLVRKLECTFCWSPAVPSLLPLVYF